jgi:hypothetical protein
MSPIGAWPNELAVEAIAGAQNIHAGIPHIAAGNLL